MSTNNALFRLENERCAIELITRGARTPTVTYLTGMGEKSCRKLHEDIFGKRPPRGRTPDTIEWFINNGPVTHLQSSVAIAIYTKLRSYGIDKRKSLISAFDMYRRRFGEKSKLCIDRLFLLTRYVGAQQLLTTTECNDCASLYIAHSLDLKDDHERCPFCRVNKLLVSKPILRGCVEMATGTKTGRALPTSH